MPLGTFCLSFVVFMLYVMAMFYAPQDPKFLKREREKARELRKTPWWEQKINQGLCYYCNGKFGREHLTMDHKVPLARGGRSSKNNIVVCCKNCNTSKKDRFAIDFIS